MNKFYNGLAVCTAVLLSACGKTVIGTNPNVQLVQDSELPAPTRADFVAAERPYFVGPFDKLRIDVFGVEQFVNFVLVCNNNIGIVGDERPIGFLMPLDAK